MKDGVLLLMLLSIELLIVQREHVLHIEPGWMYPHHPQQPTQQLSAQIKAHVTAPLEIAIAFLGSQVLHVSERCVRMVAVDTVCARV